MEGSLAVVRSLGCAYVATIMLCFALITGCSTTSQLIENGDIQLGMTLEDFESAMFWRSDVDSDPFMESHGGSGYGHDKLFYGYRLAYGGNQEKVFVFDRHSVLVAITDTIGEAEQLILNTGILNSRGQRQMRSSADSIDAYRTHGKKADYDICYMIAENADPEGTYLAEAKLRGLDCAVRVRLGGVLDRTESSFIPPKTVSERLNLASNESLGWKYRAHRHKADYDICYMIAENADPDGTYVAEAKLRRLGCADGVALGKAVGRSSPSSIPSDSLTDDEIHGLLDLLKNVEQSVEDQDTESPIIKIISVTSDGPRGIVSGVVIDDSGVAELVVNGRKIFFEEDGRFKYPTYVPNEGVDVAIRAVDFTGLVTTETVRLERSSNDLKVSSLTPVNPLIGPKQQHSRYRAALIIGVENYEASAPAQFASRDAQMFADYALEKLGIPAGNVKVLTDSEASEREILTALKVWLPTAVEPEKTDLYVFFAGHGMPTADGSSAYLVPYDGDVRLLEDTAISRKRFFDEIGHARPRSAILFFDNCYSGATRSEQLLLAARPLTIKVEETDVPDNYLVFAAGETDQIAGVEPEVKHGRFSYFVFKGLEGEADTNQDGKISAGELHAYVRESVGRFSAGAQTPTMLGDAGRWVLR